MPPLDTSASNVAVGQLAALPFENIIGGPLTAAIKAQEQAANTTVNFIQNIGLQDNGNGKMEAVNVEFIYQDGNGGFRRIVVPLLTIIPIPFIIIDSVDIAFKARIAASAKQSSETQRQSSFGITGKAEFRAGGKIASVSTSMEASYSSKKDSKSSQESQYSVEYTMDVQVKASQTGLTQGMAQILNILQDGITNKPEETQLLLFGLSPALEFKKNVTTSVDTFTAFIVDANNDPDTGWSYTYESSDPIILGVPGTASTDTIQMTPLTPGSGPLKGTYDVTITIKAAKVGNTPPEVVSTRLVRVNVTE